MQPKILVGCPTSFHKEYALEEYAKAVKSLTYSNYDILLIDNSKDNIYFNKIKSLNLPVIKGPYFKGALNRIIESRNILRKYTIKNNYDYFFSLEQDVIPPKNILENLLKHKKKVITGVYFANNKFPDGKIELIPLVYKLVNNNSEDMRPLNEKELWENLKLMQIVSCGLGCVLIHRNILKQIKFRYEKDVFDDRFFCIDLFKKKIPIYTDTSIKCKHLILNRPYHWKKIKK